MSQPNAVFAVLSEPTGMILLVRRRGSLLWSLPGGDTRNSVPMDEMLTTYCQRQVGIAPEFACRFTEFSLGGKNIAIGVDVAPKARAAARGRVEAVQWVQRNLLPTQLDPAVRIAIAMLDQQASAVPVEA